MTRRHKRMAAVAALVAGVGIATALGLVAFRKNVMYFYTPKDLAEHQPPAGATLQLGGLVEKGSLKRGEGMAIEFSMADCTNHMLVRYDGILPDLFREGQGVIATGHVGADHVFVASTILAKHDENYMPPNLAKSLQSADGKHSCAPFKSVYQPVTTGTRDSGLGTREQPGGSSASSGSDGRVVAAAPPSQQHSIESLPRVPSPQSRVPAIL